MSMVKIVKNDVFDLIFNFKTLKINGTDILGGCPQPVSIFAYCGSASAELPLAC